MSNRSSTPDLATSKQLKNNRLGTGKEQKRLQKKPLSNILVNEFKQLKALNMLSNYIPAKLYKGADTWYIYYSYNIPGTYKKRRFKEYFDINRIKDLTDRLIYGNAAVKFMNKKLAEGFNPFTAVKKKSDKANLPILQQLEIVCNNLRQRQTQVTKTTYVTMENRFKKFILQEGFCDMSIFHFDIDHANKFKRFLVSQKLSRKTVNATLSHLSLFWESAIENKVAAGNPFKDVPKIKREINNSDQEDIFEPLTQAELTAIFGYMNKNNQRNFLRFIAMIYLAWARPVEITRLCIDDIDLKNDYIKFKKSETKNSKGSFVQIVPQLKEILLEMDLKKYPGNYYLFGNNFLPSETQMYFKLPGKLWKKIVGKLQIDKRMYALKHTGNIEYLHASKDNINIKWQQSQNRHKTAEMTERYNRKLGAYFIDVTQMKFTAM
jgi:integrase